MGARLSTLVVIAALLSGCGESPAGEIEGVWLLESFNVEGADVSVEIGVNAARQPWVEIGNELFGNLGCNDFSETGDATPRYENGVLVTEEVFANLALCGPLDGSLVVVEEVFGQVLGQGPTESGSPPTVI
jgi:hypothetical protein